MTIQQTISRAFEGGYKRDIILRAREEGRNVDIGTFGHCLLDRYFWICLGNAMGWEKDHARPHNTDSPSCWCNPKGILENGAIITVHNDLTWMGYWHAFIQHLIEGRSIDSFFEQL